MDVYRAERTKINSDRLLSHEGKQHKLTRLQNQFEVKAMKDLHAMQRLHDEAVVSAKVDAERLLAKGTPQPSDVEQALFNSKMQQVKAKVIFAGSAKTALEALQTLTEVEQPTLAKQAAESVLELSSYALTGTVEDRHQAKRQLSAIHSELFKRAQPQGAEAATEALGRAKAMLNSGIVPSILAEKLGEISRDTQHYANNSYAYFTSKSEFVKRVEMGM
ncbi:hypothetical protein ACIQXV_02805 [Neobacillus sp. NPDC097160]|uniref:hypothetical protein n=1 Tax=Neobacillus sp. NPDC097160 TaxID=3364298 RepID=UPI003808BF18